MYKVSLDIPEVEYKVTLDSTVEYGSYEISNNSRHDSKVCVIKGTLNQQSGPTNVDNYLDNGEYINLQGLNIRK